MPHIIRVAGDLTCNLSCPSCRTKIIKIDDEQRERQRDLGKLLQKNLFARSSNDHIILHVSTSGEIFASPLLMEFVNNISIDQFPNLELCIQTNGLLAEKNWHQLGSMQQRVGMITVTTDAATETTYEKLRRGGKWTHCQKALAWISEKKQANGMKLVMRMVVQKQNYQEIKQFYDQACLLRADLVEYSRLSNWGTWTGEQFIEHDVFNPAHEEYHLAQKALDEIKRLPNIFLCGGIS
jgi:wyosine [tRNA(Phe)-imidazoG37] synthetase (radical SAM superfamily)